MRRERNGRRLAARRSRRSGGAVNARSAVNVSLVTEPAPHEAPERVHGVAREAAARAVVDGGEVGRAPRAQRVHDARLAPGQRCLERRGAPQRRQRIGQVQRDAAVALAERFHADPRDLARGRERVEVPGAIALDARRQDLGLEQRGGERRPLQALDDVEQRVETDSPPHDALPRGDEPAEHGGLDGLHLLAQAGERAAAQGAQHVGIAPLAMGSARPELAFEQLARVRHVTERRVRDAAWQAEPLREFFRGEGSVSARVPVHEVADRVADGSEERVRHAGGQRHTERVAVAARVFHRDVARLPRHRHREHAPLTHEPFHRARDLRRHGPPRQLFAREIAEAEEQVVHAVGGPRAIALVEPLELALEPLERLGIEQLPQLGVAEQLAELRAGRWRGPAPAAPRAGRRRRR